MQAGHDHELAHQALPTHLGLDLRLVQMPKCPLNLSKVSLVGLGVGDNGTDRRPRAAEYRRPPPCTPSTLVTQSSYQAIVLSHS